jgi:hypothetical protein
MQCNRFNDVAGHWNVWHFWFNRAYLSVMTFDCFSWTLAWSSLASAESRSRAWKAMSIIHVRIRTAYMTCHFAGGGGGVVFGWVWGQWGWTGICAAGVSILAIQLAWRLLPLQTSGRHVKNR